GDERIKQRRRRGVRDQRRNPRVAEINRDTTDWKIPSLARNRIMVGCSDLDFPYLSPANCPAPGGDLSRRFPRRRSYKGATYRRRRQGRPRPYRKLDSGFAPRSAELA